MKMREIVSAVTENRGIEKVKLWHKRLGHLNERDLKKIVNEGRVLGIEV